MKFGRQMYVSYNLPTQQQMLQAAVEKKLIEELAKILSPLE